MKTTKHYVMNNGAVISDYQHNIIGEKMKDVKQTIELPDGRYLKVISRDKSYPADKIAKAIAVGQIDISDVTQE